MIYREVTMEIHRLVLLSFILFASKVRSESFCPTSSNENLRNIVLTDSHVVVGSTSALYRLNPSLSERQQTRTLSSPNRMLVGDPDGTYSDSVLECGNSGCSLSRISDLADVRWEVSSGVVRSATDEVVGIFAAGPNGTSSLHIGERMIPQPSRRSTMSKGDLLNVDSSGGDQFDPYAYQDEGIDTRQREFLASFKFQNFVYFVFSLDHMFTSGSEIRLVRFCQEDRGGFELGNNERPRFASRYEAVLDCQSSNGNGVLMATAGYSATFINSPAPFGTESVLVSFGNFIGMGGSATQYTACAFNLTLINELMQRKYDTCIAGGVTGDNMVGFIRDGQWQVCSPFTPQQLASGITKCNFLGTLLSGLEVKNPVAPISQTAFLSHELRGYFTTLVHTSLDGSNFLFAGSSEGKLSQFQITSLSSAQFIRTITLDVPAAAGPSETNVTHLLASQNGEFIYALTPKKLFRHPVDVCEELSSCSECVDHPDPICGWCTLQGRCTRQVNCPEVSPGRREWVTTSSVCPVISSANPSTIYLPDLMEGLMITLTLANIPEDLSYRCVFDFGSPANAVVGSPQTLAVGTGDVVCVAPTRADIPPIPSGQDTVNSTVSLRYQEVDFVTQQEPVSFTNCSVHNSCTACITSAQGCGWCPFTFRCISPGSMCGVDSEEVSVTQGCPSIQPHTITGDYLLHINVSYDEPPLNIEGTNLEVFQTEFNNNEFMCEVCTGEGTSLSCRRVPAQLSAGRDQVHCMIEQNQFTYQGPEATLNATLNVVWTTISRNIDNPTGVGVILYSCKRMGTNCGQCLALLSQFGCSYCDAETPPRRTCAFTQQCSPGDIIVDISRIGECEQPQILSFTPTAGPPDGGTEIMITGINLGAQESDVTSVQIGTGSSDMVACEVTGYVPGISITCTTSEVGSMTQPQPIVVQFSYMETPVASAENFVFVEPTLERPFPVMGPMSGGTRLTIVGRSLDIGSTASVEVSDQNCPIDSINATSIVCTTPAIAEEQMGVVIRVSVDDWSGELNNMYDYVRDPTFESILPLVSFIAGGTNYTITGTGLNTVLEPRLLYYINSSPEAGTRRRRRRQPSQGTTVLVSEPCVAQSAAEMHCPAPTVDIILPEGDRITATIGLQMDGVENLTMLGVQVTVYPNPDFSTNFNEEYNEGSVRIIQIAGTGLLNMELSEYRVTIGGEQCILHSIVQATEELLCTPPQLAPGGQNEAPVMVFVGQNLNFSVGTLTYVSGDSGVPASTIAIAVGVSGGILTIIVIVVIFYCYSSNTRKKALISQRTKEDIDLGTIVPNSSLGINNEEFLKQFPKELIISSSQLRLLNSIGQGEFGVVYKAHLVKWHGYGDPQMVAVKTLKGLFTPNDVQSMTSEILKMQDFDHCHVMSLLGVCLDAGPGLSIVMPYMANGSLSGYLQKDRANLVLAENMDPDTICSVQKLLLKMCYQIAQGMEYLTEKRFVHRDLAARNCMLDSKGDIKVADFGLGEKVYTSGYIRQSKKDTGVKLPFKWMPPESLEDGIFSEKSDVWAFGVTCWEVFTGGKMPYSVMDPMSLLKELENGQRLEKPSNAACSRKIYSLMQRCWLDEPSTRPAFSELVLSLSQMLESVAGYVELSMTLVQPTAAEQ